MQLSLHTGKPSLKVCVLRVCVLLAIAIFVGCEAPNDTAADASSEPSAAAEASSGGHEHAHEDVGPHGGHMLHMEPSGGHVEWTHDDESQLITVYLTDFEIEKIGGVKFVANIGEDVEEFELEHGEGDAWSITSESLLTHLNMGEAVDVQLVVDDESGEQTAGIEAHEDHHHH